MNLRKMLFNSFYPIVKSVEVNFDTVVYDCNIITNRDENFKKIPFLGVRPPSNALYLSYITLPIIYDSKMLITKSFFASKRSTTPIGAVITFLENQFGDTVYIISPHSFISTGIEISPEIQKITTPYCSLLNFSY